MMNKEISLNNSKYFEISIGRRVTMIQVYNSKASIPIYSSNVFKPFGYLDISNLDDFDHDYVLWGIDGNFEFNVRHKGIKFGTTDHCGAIKILDQDIIPQYLRYQLELKKHELGFDRSLRASLSNMKLVSVDIPFNKNGEVDIHKQKIIVSKYDVIKMMKEQLYLQLLELENAHMELNGFAETKDFAISEIFDFPESTSEITKSYCNENKGNVPVYGSSKSDNAVIGHIKDNLNGVHYYENCISWNRTGSIGYLFFRFGKFVPNENHRVMIIKSEYINKLYPPYLKYIIQNAVRKNGYDYSNILGKEKMKKILIQIPLIDNELLNIDQQKKIANKYEQVYSIKKEIVHHLQNINEIKVSI